MSVLLEGVRELRDQMTELRAYSEKLASTDLEPHLETEVKQQVVSTEGWAGEHIAALGIYHQIRLKHP